MQMVIYSIICHLSCYSIKENLGANTSSLSSITVYNMFSTYFLANTVCKNSLIIPKCISQSQWKCWREEMSRCQKIISVLCSSIVSLKGPLKTVCGCFQIEVWCTTQSDVPLQRTNGQDRIFRDRGNVMQKQKTAIVSC